LKEGMPISLVKRDGTITKSSYKELHTLKVLVVKKSINVAGDICAIIELKDLKLIHDFENPEALKQLISTNLQ
jgi:GTP-binding protein